MVELGILDSNGRLGYQGEEQIDVLIKVGIAGALWAENEEAFDLDAFKHRKRCVASESRDDLQGWPNCSFSSGRACVSL